MRQTFSAEALGLAEQPLPNALRAYRNREFGYSMPRPDTWFERKMDVEGGQGVIFTPDPESRTTAISVEVLSLGTEVTAQDLPDLDKAFLKGLRSVPGSRVERHAVFQSDYHIGVEAQQSFEAGGTRCRRWIRLLYKGPLQARLIAQGATVAEFNRTVDASKAFNPAIKDGRATRGLTPDKSNWANPISSPPFVAYQVSCGITLTYGGLAIDADARVENEEGEAIEGLFACGELVGGLYYDRYPGGAGLTSGAVFGRIAGRTASRSSLS